MASKKKANYLPILIDLNQFPALVIGAGEIALRKIENLLEFGSAPTVIAPEIHPKVAALADAGEITLIRRKYQTGDLDGFKLVFAATGDSAADAQIRKDNEAACALLNIADVSDLCNFIMPSIIKRGDLTISISSQGVAPFFVKDMRKKLECLLSPMAADALALAGKFRRKLLSDAKFAEAEIKYELFQKFLAINWEMYLYTYGKKAAYRKMEELFE